jgi:hypothetical protein
MPKLMLGHRHPPASALAYCCFSDTRNVGDYSLFVANESLFPEFRLVSASDRWSSDVNLFGGGTLYPYSLRGWYPRRPVNVALGLGVVDPEFDGRFGILTRYQMHRWRFQHFGVRGPRSQRILADHGIAAHVTGDTALVHSAPPGTERRRGAIGISIVGETMHRLGSAATVYSTVLEVCRRLQAEGRPLRLIPFCLDDVPQMRALQAALGDRAEFVDFWDVDGGGLGAVLRALGECDLVIGERLHAIVLAAAANTPFVGLAYKPKCHDFAQSLGPEFSLDEQAGTSPDRLLALCRTALSQGPAIATLLEERVGGLRHRLREAAEEITRIVTRHVATCSAWSGLAMASCYVLGAL